MFSKKMLWLSLLSILVALSYKSFLNLPPHLVRPVLILGAILLAVVAYLYLRGYFTEEKMIEVMTERIDKPLDWLHTSPQTAPASEIDTQEEEEEEEKEEKRASN